jgi:hypothetical protein
MGALEVAPVSSACVVSTNVPSLTAIVTSWLADAGWTHSARLATTDGPVDPAGAASRLPAARAAGHKARASNHLSDGDLLETRIFHLR